MMEITADSLIQMRPIREEELTQIMEWRMRPDITKYMFTDPVLTPEGQKAWLERLDADPDSHSLMVEVDGAPCGVLTITDIDRRNRRCSWGIYLAVREKRSLETMLRIEWSLYDYILCELEFHKLWGEVLACNRPVIRMHQMCGSRIEGTLTDHILKNGRYYDVVVVGICREEWLKKRREIRFLPADMSQVRIRG